MSAVLAKHFTVFQVLLTITNRSICNFGCRHKNRLLLPTRLQIAACLRDEFERINLVLNSVELSLAGLFGDFEVPSFSETESVVTIHSKI